MFTVESCKLRMVGRFFMLLHASLFGLSAFASEYSQASLDQSQESISENMNPDLTIKCRLADRTSLIDLQGKVLAILGSDTFVTLEDFVANAGWVSFINYLAQPVADSTVSVSNGILRTIADSTLISLPEYGGGSILGLVLEGQEFQILETQETGSGSNLVRFHKIRIRGKLKLPTFKDCQRASSIDF